MLPAVNELLMIMISNEIYIIHKARFTLIRFRLERSYFILPVHTARFSDKSGYLSTSVLLKLVLKTHLIVSFEKQD